MTKKDKPLINWWHLDKIRDKSYAAEWLATHLQAVYGEGGSVIACVSNRAESWIAKII